MRNAFLLLIDVTAQENMYKKSLNTRLLVGMEVKYLLRRVATLRKAIYE